MKKHGVWLKPLKLLGLVYDGEEGTLRASTRKGSKLLYDKGDLVDIDLIRPKLESARKKLGME